MHEIRFMGKRIDTGEWVYGCLTRYSDSMSYITVDLIENKTYEVHTETVGQFIGLKDKKGREIYKGDMVQVFGSGLAFHHAVVFENGAYGYKTEHDFISFAGNHNFQWKNNQSEHIEVIGNIHDKKEIATCETEVN
jgi:uncharacterized phage protein (TIGR01671 family)